MPEENRMKDSMITCCYTELQQVRKKSKRLHALTHRPHTHEIKLCDDNILNEQLLLCCFAPALIPEV